MPRKHLNVLLGVLLLAALVYWLYPFLAGGRNMQAFCQKLQVNQSRQDVERAVDVGGLRLTLGKDRNGVVHDPRAFGRFICEVKFEGDHLVSAQYFLND